VTVDLSHSITSFHPTNVEAAILTVTGIARARELL